MEYVYQWYSPPYVYQYWYTNLGVGSRTLLADVSLSPPRAQRMSVGPSAQEITMHPPPGPARAVLVTTGLAAARHGATKVYAACSSKT
eukprot:SAG31_NODE_39906_length_284_cov_1.378378_1_plen_87_part_01